ncbi:MULTISPECIES: helix-turn-helix domain-containing protein [unclassified Candidatus Tisiphia]|uniref:helix-turn-helix domain-containing protein n=1 Tax=unclassified Candidatus Tisiphia TaxID=2996318 RepID=UPI00312C76A9
MPSPYSYDLRSRVIEHYEKHKKIAFTCETFKISRSMLYVWIRLKKQTGPIRIENFEKITEIFLQEQKDDRLNIAQKLLQAGVDFDIIEQATLIKKEEITNIKVS